MNLNELVDQAYSISREHGFHEDDGARRLAANIPEKLALIHSEVSEALEHYRDGNGGHPLNKLWKDESKNPPKPDGFATELADVVIRVGDLCGMLGIDLDRAVVQKMLYNRSRPFRHGGKKC